MKVYSDRDLELDILNAMEWPVYGSCSPLGGRLRVRRYGWDVELHSMESNRYHNSGTHGANTESSHRAASYTDYGRFIAALYEVDPCARIGRQYDSREEFHEATGGKFRAAEGSK